MGSNDHVPVPDPKPRVHVPPRTLQPEGRVLPGSTHSIAPAPLGGPTTTNERLDSLEKSRERHDAQAVALRNSIVEIVTGMANLTRLLKQTARGVERLAQGHSQGNLGLPTDEDWTGFKT